MFFFSPLILTVQQDAKEQDQAKYQQFKFPVCLAKDF